MSTTIELNGASVEVSTYAPAEQVIIETEDGESKTVLFVTPATAVQISRALVAAAAEALGVKV